MANNPFLLKRGQTCGQCHFFEVFCEEKLNCEAWETECNYAPPRFKENERGYSIKEMAVIPLEVIHGKTTA